MNKIKILTVTVIVLVLLNLILLGLIYTHRPPHDRPSPPNGTMGEQMNNPDRIPQEEQPKYYIIQKLGLDEHQKVQYDSLITIHQQSLHRLESQISQIKSQLYTTLSNPSTSVKDSIMDQLKDLYSKIEATHYDHFNDLRLICKSNQLEQYQLLTHELTKLFMQEKNPPPPPKE